MNAVIPLCLLNSLGLRIFVNSLRIFLSLLLVLVSLNPGVSINVIRPVVPVLTTPVTDSYDCLWSKVHTCLLFAKCSLYSLEMVERAVDFPWPHSPIVTTAHGSDVSSWLDFSIVDSGVLYSSNDT